MNRAQASAGRRLNEEREVGLFCVSEARSSNSVISSTCRGNEGKKEGEKGGVGGGLGKKQLTMRRVYASVRQL